MPDNPLLQTIKAETDEFGATKQRMMGDRDDECVSLAHAVGTRNGKKLDTFVATFFRGKDGLVTEIRDLSFDWTAWEQLWAK